MKIRIWILLLMLCVMTSMLMTFVGCNHIELDYPVASRPVKVEIRFDWADHPEASPEGMTVYFFRLDLPAGRAGKVPPTAYDFKGRDGGTVYLAPGRYAAICHNSDSDRHGFVGYQDYETFGLRLTDLRQEGGFSSSIPGLRAIGDERFANSPDDIWISASEMIEVASPGPEETQSVSFRMQAVVHRYRFIIHNPVNYSKAMKISAAISGMSGTLHPGRGMSGEETVTHIFEMIPSPTGGLTGELLTFGHCGSKKIVPHQTRAVEASHTLAVTATLADGQTWQSVHDVTVQIHGSSSPDAVVVLDSLLIPKPIGGGGWAPAVEDWVGTTEFVGM